MDTTKLPAWNLNDLFTSITDPKINASLEEIKAKVKSFAEHYRGTINTPNVDPNKIATAFDTYEQLIRPMVNLSGYSQLIFTADSQNPAHGAFMQRISTELETINRDLLFFELELMDMPLDQFDRLLSDPALTKRNYYLQLVAKRRTHHLTEAEEKLLGMKSLTGAQAFARLFEQEISQMTFNVEGQKEPMSEPATLHLLYNPDRTVRQSASAALSVGFRNNLPRLAFIYNMLIADKATDDRLRQFESPEAARHLANQTDQASVDALNEALRERTNLVSEYYEFKRKLLGLEEMNDADRYAPLPDTNVVFEYDDAKKIVLESFQAFHPRFAEEAKRFFDNNWIDAASRPGKRGGAACFSMTPDHHPYVYVNYQGGVRDVKTLAHELGHAVHFIIANKHTLFDFDAPLTICETASIFGEMMVFEKLKAELNHQPRQKLGLIMSKIEEVFASTFRQIAMYRFEQDVHAHARQHGELSPDQISEYWMKHQKEMFGSSVNLRPDYAIWWAYISHVFTVPFYVYAYAFGELLTLSIYQQYKTTGPAMVNQFMELLEAGGSADPKVLVGKLGFQLDQKSFWTAGLDLVKNLMDEAKQLASQL